MIAIGESDGRINVNKENNYKAQILEAKKRNIIRVHRKHSKGIYCGSFLPNLAYLATGSDDLVNLNFSHNSQDCKTL